VRKTILVAFILVICPILFAQQALNNNAIIKLVKAGLSDDLIVSTINASAASYDTTAEGIIALKTAGASDKVVAAIVVKASAPAPMAQAPIANPVQAPQAAAHQYAVATQQDSKPRVFLQSKSKGGIWTASRDQSMEMSKDFEKDCPSVSVTINQNAADYTIILNHIEFSLSRDNQIQIANRNGDLIARTKEGGTINGNVKKACGIILSDWAINLAIRRPGQ